MLKHIFFIGLFFINLHVVAQHQDDQIKVLQKANRLIAEKQFEEAYIFLDKYNKGEGDVYTLQLQAQLAYWLQKNRLADSLFNHAISRQANLPALNMDYGRFLFETGRYKESVMYLEKVENDSLYAAEAKLNLAYIDYWEMNYGKAQERVGELLLRYPDFTAAKDLSLAIKKSKSLHWEAGIDFISDDQPYRQTHAFFKGYFLRSKWLAPQFSLHGASLHPEKGDGVQTMELWLGNGMRFGSNGPSLNINGGMFFHEYESKAKVMYDVTIRQQIQKGLNIELNASRKPYQYTLSSVPLSLLSDHLHGALSLDHKDWLGKAAWETNKFPDNNKVSTGYFWGLAPVLRKENVLLQAGYGFTYANSDTNRFVQKPTSQPPVPGEVEGWYNPYFTPIDQQIHAVLAAAKFQFSNVVTLHVHAQYGVFAKNTTAWFYRNAPGNNAPLLMGSIPVEYHPVSFSIAFAWKLNDRLVLHPGYDYNHLFFFTSHRVGVKINFE
jgi:tetratricopeptide (TPR) repeat protein